MTKPRPLGASGLLSNNKLNHKLIVTNVSLMSVFTHYRQQLLPGSRAGLRSVENISKSLPAYLGLFSKAALIERGALAPKIFKCIRFAHLPRLNTIDNSSKPDQAGFRLSFYLGLFADTLLHAWRLPAQYCFE